MNFSQNLAGHNYFSSKHLYLAMEKNSKRTDNFSISKRINKREIRALPSVQGYLGRRSNF
ncbi:hypothetical protein BpHYR1_011215 [Brachionus plicatilis]|uniref:Uncharacterized protein n=1 Tax=Brachionus plicatilis TaxID=10195 RepID=A0A3M7SNK8_BRAPC|nr:hypothetical protein BpHYR1_011215 [Brachionus plicatilis]